MHCLHAARPRLSADYGQTTTIKLAGYNVDWFTYSPVADARHKYWAYATSESKIHLSKDGGETWESHSKAISDDKAVVLGDVEPQIHPLDPSLLLLKTTNGDLYVGNASAWIFEKVEVGRHRAFRP